MITLDLTKTRMDIIKELLIWLGRLIALAMRSQISTVVRALNYPMVRLSFSTPLVISITCRVLYLFFEFVFIRESV